jgi:hypothetical protein
MNKPEKFPDLQSVGIYPFMIVTASFDKNRFD